jgi:DNA primase catalytic core
MEVAKPAASLEQGGLPMNPDFDQIKKTVDIVRVVESYGIALKRQGKEWVGLCPFHEDKTPSLNVSPTKQVFRCPACNAAGNVIQFVARKENLTDREAAQKLLGAIPGVMRASELPTAGKKEPSSPAVEVDEATRAKLLERVAGFYAKTLQKDRAGLNYLKSRRLDDPAMLETFQVGYCNGTLRNALPKSGEVIEQLKAIGILNEKGNECFYGRVIVPIFECEPHGQKAGVVVGLYGRHLTDDQRPHLYLKGPHCGVFNGACAKMSQTIIVTEALFDAMSLWAAGFHNVISLYGKDGWTPDHQRLLEASGVREIILALDADARGQEAAKALEIRLSGFVKATHHVIWPEGVKDANAFFLSRTADEFCKLLPESSKPTAEETAGKEEIAITPEGFTLSAGGRRYELCAIEKPSAARLKATVKALSEEPGRFHIDTVDFYLSRSRKGFIAEAARLFRELPEVIESDVNRIILAVEKYMAQKLEGASPTAFAIPDADRLEAMRMARNAGLVDELQRDFGKLGIIGEETNRLLLYLAMTSRKMDDPLAVLILSSSGAGKSHLQDAVLSLCPDEDLIKLTSLTGQALFYKGEDSLRHKCLAIAEVAGSEDASYALRNLISEKKLTKETTVTNGLTGRLETQANTVYGPTSVFGTTTQPDTDAETKSRYVLLSVDESPEQTKAILEAQRQSHTLEGRKRRKARETVLAKHHAFQRLLEPVAVVNPFEPLLSYGDDRLAFRRDHPKYLNLILAVTFLYQMQRPRKHDPEFGEYIETTLDDIAIANDLAHELFGQSLDDLSFPSRQLLRLVGDYVRRRAAEEKKPLEAVEFTRRDLREAIKWTEARLRLHLGELMRLEYVGAVSGRFGQQFNHRLLVDPDEVDLGGRCVPGLKSVEHLRTEANITGLNVSTASNLASVLPNLASQNGNLASEKGHLATTSQVEGCEVEKLADADKHRANGYHVPNLASQAGRRIYVLRTEEAPHIHKEVEATA